MLVAAREAREGGGCGVNDVQPELGSTRRRKKQNSGRVEWNTPQVVIDCVTRLDEITLDPCWNPRSKVSAEWSFDGTEIDGLKAQWHSWAGLAYVNPPYGAALKQWVPKILEEAKVGAEIIALVPNSTETVWFRKLFMGCQAAMCWKGRLTFDGAPAPAFFGSAVFYFGHRPYAFADAFAGHAYCVKLALRMEAA
jgi:hypothetical protein